MKLLIICSIVIIAPYLLFAQACTGTLVDIESKEPIPYAHVFIYGTSYGTTSNLNGSFSFKTNGYENLPLIVSVIGYQTIRVENDYVSNALRIELHPKTFKIGEVEVTPDKWSNKKKIRIFKEEFLGKGSNAEECSILNQEDIDLRYYSETKTLKASSDKPIEILNSALGYSITYILDKFVMNELKTCYQGNYVFEELPCHKREKSKVLRKRKRTYKGSRMHFVRSLWNGYIASQGFYIFDMKYNPLNVSDIRYVANDQRYMVLEDTVKIKYLRKNQSSQIIPSEWFTRIEKNGYFEPTSLYWRYDIAVSRVADLLPFDYLP